MKLGEPGNHLFKYWSFFWPLAIMGMVTILAGQFQVAYLARNPDGTYWLAIFAIGSSLYLLLHAPLNFIPQMTNVFVRSPHARRVTRSFIFWTGLVLCLPIALVAWTPLGRPLVSLLFATDPETTENAVEYIGFLTPIMLIDAMKHYYSGLLIQCYRTRVVSLLNFLYVAAVALFLYTGFQLEWRPLPTVAGSLLIGSAVHMILLGVACRFLYRLPPDRRHEDLRTKELWTFYWPIAFTGMMFGMSRPLLFFFLARADNAVEALAAMRVAFDVNFFFVGMMNQFRNLYVTFGKEDMRGVWNFSLVILAILVAILALIGFTPVGYFIFGTLLGVSGPVLHMAIQCTLVLGLVPFAMTLRNYYHGLSMIRRTTGRMGVGGVLRIALIFVVGMFLTWTGWVNHITVGFLLFVGFMAEALTMRFIFRMDARKRARAGASSKPGA